MSLRRWICLTLFGIWVGGINPDLLGATYGDLEDWQWWVYSIMTILLAVGAYVDYPDKKDSK
jgi:hypothetical protein